MAATVAERAARTVLVVDDDACWREVVLEALAQEGVRAVGAVNGHDALVRLQRGEITPDVVVSDLSMPVLDGWQLRAHMLNDPRLARIPVVVVSGDDPGSLPADRRLAKPCAPDDLLRTVNGLAAARRAA